MSAFKKIRFGGVPEHFNLPWHLAIEADLFRDIGLDVEFVEVPGGTGAMTRMLNEGELEAAMLLTEGGVADILNGSPNRLVKVYADSPLIWGIHVNPTGRVRTPEQIQGKRYAISRYGSGSHLIAIVDAAERGWPTDEIEFVVVGNLDGAREALASGKADIFFWEKFMTKPLVDSGEFDRVAERVVPWPSFSVSVRQELLPAYGPQLKSSLSVAQDKAQTMLRLPNIVDVFATRYGLLAEDVQSWLDSTRWHSGFDCPTDSLRVVADYLCRLNIVPDAPFDPTGVWYPL